MSPLLISRILFVILITNEALVLARSSKEERAQIVYPPFMPLVLILLFAPLFYAIALPAWLGWTAAAVQASGLLLEVAAEVQLLRARSFSIAPRVPAEIQQGGIYHWLENPIYAGLLLQFLGWGVLMPLSLLNVVLHYRVFRDMIRTERAVLASRGVEHRGLDTFLWGPRAARPSNRSGTQS